MPLEALQKERLKKLKNIQRLGINPYPAKSVRKQEIFSARKMMGKKVVVAGRIRSLRPHGKITFADIEDASGKIQLFFSQSELNGEKYEFLTNFDLGDFIETSGEIFKTQAGEISVRVSDYKLLTKSIRPLPSAWYGLEDVEERYRQRYVDLTINPEVRKVFETRSKIVKLLRNFMEEKGFIEVETPTLQPLYGGATAKPFTTHHNALDIKLYLRISDELYLKRLIVGGYEKVFEICKDFRNEGQDRQHNPEFTMMEFYWAYADYEDLMKLTEEMVAKIVKLIHDKYIFEFEGQKLDFKFPFKRITFNKLVKENCGIDLAEIKTEGELKKVIKEKEIELELHGVVGFGPLVDELYKSVARSKIKQPTFIVDYPYDMLPLAKAKDSDPKKAGSFQLICMGYEIVKAYNELNDPIEQQKRWKEEMALGKKGLEEYQVLDEDYIRALEYGMPPTAGWGMGVDRLVSLLTNQHTIKDVILFPTLRPEKKGKK
ncbi:lysine--tRNA ligase [Candidatus Daviesbacteria bacterium RIFCSPLOWO2_01_FULL_39_12]|uniref:Lysine--tRNA ligase n=1 Tax=Candidatus Daviesbacteria bacterium RIFCSPLOWO2_01_FULL_39_12 TaxID=1797785 RepID=A0A1F5KPA9_9BACT|nr:MAG: lysine--tRNA ligase [Candidatus Daviesbacteria bacterium RIFCSPHIGHO2_02_FULL_39_8]OGE42722.1 MAG: lysine--tRNA ligase [Candidatus Daviesbacteria bacterium RIFCSPLOWO2_01_FULL_39_12]